MSIPALSSKLRSNFKIGVFDSGVGGLTVLREMHKHLPVESIIYFGDTARVPYGNRSKSEILRFVREIIAWMMGLEVKLIVMACNTSSALVLEEVRSEFPIPILGIVLPGARGAVKSGRRIGVISTEATAKSDAYLQAVQEIDSTIKVWQMGCPEFVPLIENGRIHDPYTLAVAKRYLEPLIDAGIDTLVYGCTHYPHLAPVFKQILPSHIKLVDPARHLTIAAAQELDILGLGNPGTVRIGAIPTKFYVSGDSLQFAKVSQQWLGYQPLVRHVSIETLEVAVLEEEAVLETTSPVAVQRRDR
ncbi:glutamate racemase [cf. Phormidesmis sp. LEGE 11477]|uniref:glutamate racemase n=1 Tax=cf. Phormidesmis sp. LEGE 11477 TaxID=1828680 RepID=UPI001882B3C4|nr:glutamate racemase [cf. Phormidesmis sp. LEGE 11477]MBE9060526.1 glutamate racemase [cf. Phormidesmis sp. LEGE 11477]